MDFKDIIKAEVTLADDMQRVIDDCDMEDVRMTPDGPRVAILVKHWHDEPYQGEWNDSSKNGD